MKTNDLAASLTRLFSELVDGATDSGGFVLNSGDVGLLRSLDKLSATEASDSIDGGATIAAHAQHLQYDLALMNRWAQEGGDPFSDAKSEEAWKTSRVTEVEWQDIRDALRTEAREWLGALGRSRDITRAELAGMIASIAHLGYHFGAMRQIASGARGPKGGTFVKATT